MLSDGSRDSNVDDSEGAHPDDFGRNMAKFAIGAIALMDMKNPIRIYVPGRVYTPGLKLTVEWKQALPVLLVPAILQLVLLISTALWANNVIIKDDSYLSVAYLLRPVYGCLGNSGCLLTGEEISEAISKRIGRGKGLVYGHQKKGEYYHLELSEKTLVTQQISDEFPNGKYDGDGGGVQIEAEDVDENDLFVPSEVIEVVEDSTKTGQAKAKFRKFEEP